MTAYVYLLHFEKPYPNGRHPQHYLGVAQDVEDRILEHRAGSSKSRLTRACVALGDQDLLRQEVDVPLPEGGVRSRARVEET
jgi:hypothetical protein